MVQLVFVHGVATRGGASYDAQVANRDLLFRTLLFEEVKVEIHSPLWGDLVPRIDERVFATGQEFGSFSLGVPDDGLLGGASPAGAQGLAVAGIAGPKAMVDAVGVTLVERAEANGQTLSDQELDAFREAMRLTTPEASPPPLGTDADVTKALEAGGARSYGIGTTVFNAVQAIGDRVRNSISTVTFNAVREHVSPAVALFLGDVFVYLKGGASRDTIRARVAEAIANAHAASQGAEPLVLIGHSLGGVILCDMLANAAEVGLPADLKVKALLTVGSQPGLFQSLGAFGRPPQAEAQAPKPACVETWLNVFDPIDPLAFCAEPMFLDVEDLVFDSITGLASAHTTYFKRPQFYARCRKRLQDLGVV